MDKPTYQHDCATCVFLGDYLDAGHLYDLYVHNDYPASFKTVIARWGNEGAEYTSGLRSSLPVLIEAEKRAREKGYLDALPKEEVASQQEDPQLSKQVETQANRLNDKTFSKEELQNKVNNWLDNHSGLMRHTTLENQEKLYMFKGIMYQFVESLFKEQPK